METTCEGCVHARPAITDDQENIIMQCHRFPPVIFVLNEEVTQGFPNATDRCGEYKKE